MRPKLQKRSVLKLVGRNETQTLKARRIKVCKSNYPIAKGYWKLMTFADYRKRKWNYPFYKVQRDVPCKLLRIGYYLLFP